MSKNKDIEKLHDKQLEKKIEIKEHAKIEKHEPKEIKEPIKEKHEIKEAKNELKEHKLEKLEHKEKPEPKEVKDKDKDKEKEKHEPKEIKEAAKEKIEVKEGPKEKHEPKEIKEPIKEHKEKDLDKQIFEKGGKELVEGQHPGVDVTNPPITTHLGHAGGGGAPAAKAKEIEKIKAEKEHIEKIKPEKEHLKNELKDLKHEKNELKEHKIEIKEVKHEKVEIKEIEKAQHKDLLPDKAIFEGGPKGIVEGPIDKGTIGDPGPIFNAKGKPEERLADLENAVTRLSHFIGAELRPDLSGGALKQEPDVAKTTPAKKTAAKRRARPKKTAG